jgi:hypothetical protein
MTINLAAKKMKIEDNMKYNGRWEGNLIGSKLVYDIDFFRTFGGDFL